MSHQIEKEVDRILTLLRNKIRERGFTQLEVQEKLNWGRSYISQLLTKQKSLRVEQVLMILETINVNPK
ncbi:MAG: helix-turn-helix transcriptional regulator, partial [Desulfuromonadales bacterium]|nr:helix-turn-helix transcriptional regulator [Desulfuromonadales bacterium]